MKKGYTYKKVDTNTPEGAKEAEEMFKAKSPWRLVSVSNGVLHMCRPLEKYCFNLSE